MPYAWKRLTNVEDSYDLDEEKSQEEVVTFSNVLSIITLSNVLRWLRTLSIHLLPSWISNRFLSPSAKSRTPVKWSPTDYLNGIRGVAACSVVFQHFFTLFYSSWPWAGYGADATGPHFIQLPFIRLIYSGKFSVAIFYILSGYVLAYKPMRLIRESNLAALANHLVSAIFRRFLRLFLPIIPPMALVAFMAAYGFLPDRGASKEVLGVSINGKDNSWWENLTQYVTVYDKTITPWTWDEYHPPFIEALYTLKIEFRGSILVFTLVLGLARTKQWIRMAVLSIISLYALTHGRWEAFLFTQGIILAEYKHIRLAREEQSTLPKFLEGDNVPSCRLAIAKRIFWAFIFIFALFLGSWPLNGCQDTPGLATLTRMTPTLYASGPDAYQNFWLAIAALLLLHAFEHLPILQRPFETSFIRYLGDISFSLYAVHFPIIYASLRFILFPLTDLIGNYDYVCVMIGLLNLPILFWVSDVQWRLVDINAVKLTRVLENFALADAHRR